MRLAPKGPNLLYGICVTLLAYICFAIAAAIVRRLGSSFPVMQIILIQSVISLFFVLPSFFKKKSYKIKKDLVFLHLVRDIAGVASFFCYFLAIKRMNLVDATVLTYTAPFYTPIIWTLWTKDRVEKGVWWAIILGFIGIAFILKPTHHILKAGSLIGFSAGILCSISLVAIRRLNQRFESSTRVMFYYFLVSSIIALPFAFFQWHTPNIIEFLFLLSMGVLMALAQLFLITAYKHGTASFLSPIAYSMIVFTGIISWIIFNRAPGWLSFIGGFLIIIGGTISYILKVKPERFIEIFEHPPEEKLHFWQKIKLKNNHIEIHKKKQEQEIDEV